ncbi:MAG: HAD family hydrolase [Monoglobales bacterium]
MKKFENMLLISDIDGTLIGHSWEISKENIQAATYFMENGGFFSYATGRQTHVAQKIIDQLKPNAPVICYNGAAIYDYLDKKYLWSAPLENDIAHIITDIAENCPNVNIEINTADYIYVLKQSASSFPRYQRLVPLFKIVDSVNEVPLPWLKIVFVMESDYMPVVRSYVESQPYYKDFQFGQSASFLYELLSFGINKGSALPHLVKNLGHINKTIAVGDNENDIELLRAADVGYAVADASPLLLSNFTNIAAAREDHVLADIIERLDKNLI